MRDHANRTENVTSNVRNKNFNEFRFFKNFYFLVDPCNETPNLYSDCFASMSKYYYDVARNQCIEFTYGGCAGSANMFDTKSDCESFCYLV